MKNRSQKLSIQNLNKTFLIRIFTIVFLFAGIASTTVFYVSGTKDTNAATNPYGTCTIEYFSSSQYVNIGSNGNTSCEIGTTIPDNAGFIKSDIHEVVFPGTIISTTYYAPYYSPYLFSSDGSGNQPNDTYWSNLQKFTLGNAAKFDTSRMITMEGMFREAKSLTSAGIQPLINQFNTSNVTDMNTMFYGDSSITELDLSSFNTSNVTNMALMFFGMNNLETLTLGSNFTTNNVTNMGGMFATYYDVVDGELVEVENKLNKLILKAPFTFKSDTYLNGAWLNNSTNRCYDDFSVGTTLPAGTYTKQTSCTATPDPDPEDTPIDIPISPATASKYDGTEKTAPNYDSATMQWQDDPMCDSIYQTNAGDYSSCVVPKTGYIWSDGTKTPKYLYWTIPKGDPSSPSLPSGLQGYVGNTLNTVTLGSNFRWRNERTVIRTGTNSYEAYYNPDTSNYNDLPVSISVEGITITNHPAKPTNLFANNLTYNGSEQTVTIYNIDSNTMYVASGNKGTYAGEYTAYVTSKTGQWADGTTDPVTVNWQILKAAPQTPITPANLEGRVGNLLSTVSPGTGFSWANNSQQISLGKNSYSAKYNPDPDNYNDLDVSIDVSGYSYQTRPSLSPTSFQYDGNSHSPTINNSLGCSGQTSATDAGLYTITCILPAYYKWSDGSTNDISLRWSIYKVVADPESFKETAETPIYGVAGNGIGTLDLPDGCEWETPSGIIEHGENKQIALCGENSNHSATGIEFTVIGMTHIDVPTPVEGLIYNGNYQSGLDGFDETKMEVVDGSDESSQRDAKSYRTVLRPKTYYIWWINDGEVYPNENERWIDWSIAKKQSSPENFPTDKLSGDVGDKLEDIVPYNGCSWETKTETVKSGENLYSAICYENNDKDNFESVTIKIPVVGTDQPIKPTIATDLYYNGKEQTGVIGFNSSTMELVSGTLKATEAGTYSVEIKSKTGKWSDKSTANFKTNWTIKKRVAPSDHPSEYPSQKDGDNDSKNVYKTAPVGDKLKTIDPPSTNAFKCYWKNPEELIKKGENAYVAVCAEDGDFDNNESFEMNVYILGIEKDTKENGQDVPNTGFFGSNTSFAKAITSALIVSPFIALAILVLIKNRRPKIDFKKRS